MSDSLNYDLSLFNNRNPTTGKPLTSREAYATQYKLPTTLKYDRYAAFKIDRSSGFTPRIEVQSNGNLPIILDPTDQLNSHFMFTEIPYTNPVYEFTTIKTKPVVVKFEDILKELKGTNYKDSKKLKKMDKSGLKSSGGLPAIPKDDWKSTEYTSDYRVLQRRQASKELHDSKVGIETQGIQTQSTQVNYEGQIKPTSNSKSNVDDPAAVADLFDHTEQKDIEDFLGNNTEFIRTAQLLSRIFPKWGLLRIKNDMTAVTMALITIPHEVMKVLLAMNFQSSAFGGTYTIQDLIDSSTKGSDDLINLPSNVFLYFISASDHVIEIIEHAYRNTEVTSQNLKLEDLSTNLYQNFKNALSNIVSQFP